MLKNATVYDVSVEANGQNFDCFLLTPPTVEALAEVANKECAPTEITEILSLPRAIVMPCNDEDEATTPIVIAGVTLGSIRVVPVNAYVQPAKRGRKPKPTATDADVSLSPPQ